jgi:hypothetical protein
MAVVCASPDAQTLRSVIRVDQVDGRRNETPHAQSSTKDPHQAALDTRARGYWVDPSTGLTWAGKDNFGRDLNWRQASKYCADLRLAGYTNWRLPTIVELEGIFDAGASAIGLSGKRNDRPQPYHVKGDLLLTGLEWSASNALDREGRFTGRAYRFDFVNGGRFQDEWDYRTGKRALCVRGDVHPGDSVPPNGPGGRS